MTKKGLGDWGEALARHYLQNANYRILNSNWRYSRMGELDLVALSPDHTLIAIEVKTGYAASGVSPLEQLTDKKLHKLERLLQAYIQLNPQYSHTNCQIDALVIECSAAKPHIKHYKNLSTRALG
jgi:putative endonuclease